MAKRLSFPEERHGILRQTPHHYRIEGSGREAINPALRNTAAADSCGWERNHGVDFGVYQSDTEPFMHPGRCRYGDEHGYDDDWKREGGGFHGITHHYGTFTSEEIDEPSRVRHEAEAWLDDDAPQRHVYAARVDLGYADLTARDRSEDPRDRS